MSVVHADNYFKVVNTKNRTTGGRYSNQYLPVPRSALLNKSPHTIDYSLATPNGRGVVFVGPKTNGTPIILFDNVDNAREFAGGNTYRAIYRAEVYGEVLTVEKVLKLQLGWSDQAVKFWADVVAGNDLAAYKLHNAPKGTVALFGVIRLLEVVPLTTPKVTAEPLG